MHRGVKLEQGYMLLRTRPHHKPGLWYTKSVQRPLGQGSKMYIILKMALLLKYSPLCSCFAIDQTSKLFRCISKT